jgi:hypothetical protein
MTKLSSTMPKLLDAEASASSTST